jgi:RimJ/RimL family protein N-acetyltransferase
MQDDDIVYDPEAYGAAVAARLASEPNLVPLSREPQDIARFADFELSNYLSGRLDEQVDPDALDATVRQDWIARALKDDEGEALYLNRPFAIARRPYWIVNGDERVIVGTIAFRGAHGKRWPTLVISSVFIRPRYRRQGWMTRILDLIKNAAFPAGVERVSLDTEWSNRTGLHF